jgi:hypothetical protein
VLFTTQLHSVFNRLYVYWSFLSTSWSFTLKDKYVLLCQDSFNSQPAYLVTLHNIPTGQLEWWMEINASYEGFKKCVQGLMG